MILFQYLEKQAKTMWIFGKNQAPAQQPVVSTTPLQQQRIKQIRSLQSACSNVVEERRDFDYRVPFKCGNTPCALSVSLPVQFPSEKPTVFVSPAMDHSWVDENMQVRFEGREGVQPQSPQPIRVERQISPFWKHQN